MVTLKKLVCKSTHPRFMKIPLYCILTFFQISPTLPLPSPLPISWRPPLYCIPPFFSNFVQPQPSPCYPLPATSTPTTLFVVLFLWLNGWLCQIMDLHTLSLDTLVPEGYCYVFYATRHQVYWSLTHNVVFLLLLYLISQTQTHTHKDRQYTQGAIDWHTHINIYHLLCANSSYLY